MRLGDIARPDTGSQAVLRLVCTREEFLDLRKRLGNHHRPEDFFPHDAHVRFYIFDDSWLDEIATAALTRTARDEAGSVLFSLVEIIGDPRQLLIRDQRTHLGIVREPGTQLNFLSLGRYTFHYLVKNILLHH